MSFPGFSSLDTVHFCKDILVLCVDHNTDLLTQDVYKRQNRNSVLADTAGESDGVHAVHGCNVGTDVFYNTVAQAVNSSLGIRVAPVSYTHLDVYKRQMSGDEKLIQAYQEAQDIHRMTASQVFHVPFDEVTDLQRRNAKAVNFGIVYGISSFGLSQDLSITRKEAAQYIENYFETYPKIKGFLDGLVTEAKEKGYVTTMFGRRRPVPELKSSKDVYKRQGLYKGCAHLLEGWPGRDKRGDFPQQ